MADGRYHAPEYFTEHFQGSNVDYNAIKAGLHAAIGSFAGKSETKIAQEIKEYFLKNGIKLKTTNQQDSSNNRSTYSTRSSSAGGNVNITINENKGLSFWDYLLLQNLFGSKTTIIHTTPVAHATYSAPSQEKNDKSKEWKVNALIFCVALCVITHLAVCAIYQMYFKEEAGKPGKSIDYLANRQLGIAIFQLVFGLASLIGGGACISQSEIFFPLLINTFICLFSACLFYHERNNTLKTEVEPYLKLAELFVNDERRENQRTRPSTYSTGCPGTTYDGPPPPYFSQDPNNQSSGYSAFDVQQPGHSAAQHPSAPAYDGSYTYPNLSTQFSNPNVTEFGGHSKS